MLTWQNFVLFYWALKCNIWDHVFNRMEFNCIFAEQNSFTFLRTKIITA